MELAMTNGFSELSFNEAEKIDGGLLPLLGIVLFSVLGTEVTVGMCLAAGAAIGLVAGGAVAIKG